jgi:hypothetical protein
MQASGCNERLLGPGSATKNPVSVKKKQGSEKLRAMADPLDKKVRCPAPGQHLGVLCPKALSRETSICFRILARPFPESKFFEKCHYLSVLWLLKGAV